MRKFLAILFIMLLSISIASADWKLHEMTEATSPNSNADLIYIVVDPSGTPLDRKMTMANFFKYVYVDGHTHGTALTAAQVSGTLIHNYGQGANDVVIKLPTASAGYSFLAVVSETQAANYWRIQAGISDKIYLDGVAGTDGYNVGQSATTIGSALSCSTFLTGTGVYDWSCISNIGTWTAASCLPSTGACQNVTTGECGTTYTVCEDFEGVVDCDGGGALTQNNCRVAWEGSLLSYQGTGIEGTYGLLTTGSGVVGATKTFSATDTIYVFFKWKVGNATDTYFIFYVGSGAVNISETSAEKLTMTCGGVAAAETPAYTVGTVYNVWLSVVRLGAGADATCNLYISSTSTKGAAVSTVTTGTIAASPTYVLFQGYEGSFPNVYDHIRIKTTDMTGVPD